jgi:acetyl esterase/lipase
MSQVSKLLAVVILACGIGCVCAAEQRPSFDVWPGRAPGEPDQPSNETLRPAKPGARAQKLITDVSRPTLTVYRPAKDKDTGAAVLICPGGGYSVLAMDLEGEEVAAWLNSIGVTGVVLKYRVPRRKGQPPYLAPLQDGQRGLSLLRSRAKEFGIDPQSIGILGFSAGGHLSAAVSTNFDKRAYEALDEVDKVSCRPDFTVLIYPGYLATKEGLAPEIRVTAQTPPTFFAHAGDDGVGPENSTTLYLALRRVGVPAELHIYASGGHGFGLRKSEHSCSTWPQSCELWLKSRGLLQGRK